MPCLARAEKAFQLAKKLDDPGVLAGSYNNLAVLSGKSGDQEKALEYYEKGLKIALENNSINWIVTLHNNLAEGLWISGRFREAFETSRRGMEFSRKVGGSR